MNKNYATMNTNNSISTHIHMRRIFKLIAGIALSIFFMGSLAFAQRLVLPANRQEITSNAYQNWYERIDESEKEAKLTQLQEKIVTTVRRFSDTNVISLLTFIDDLAEDDLKKALDQTWEDSGSDSGGDSGNNSGSDSGNNDDSDDETDNDSDAPSEPDNNTDDDSENQQGEQTTQLWFTPSYQEWPQVLLAWSDKQILWGFEVTARLEPILIETVQIQANKDIWQLVDTRYIATKDGIILWQRSSQRWGSSITIENIDYQIPQNGESLYLLADLLPIWYNNPVNEWEIFTFDFTVTQATGVFSNESVWQAGFSSDQITITPLAVDFNKRDSAFWYNTDTRLTQWENTLLIFEVSAEWWENTQIPYPTPPTLILEEINVTINNYTATSNLESAIFLERIDKPSQAIQATTIQGNILQFSAMPESISAIDAGQTHAYRLYGDITLSSSQQWENIQATLDNLMNWWILRKEETAQTVYNLNASNLFRIRWKRVME